MSEPSIGRIVHLQDDKRVVAAIITAVYEDGVSLTVFMPDKLPGYAIGRVPFSEEPKPSHWSWPPRVP